MNLVVVNFAVSRLAFDLKKKTSLFIKKEIKRDFVLFFHVGEVWWHIDMSSTSESEGPQFKPQ